MKLPKAIERGIQEYFAQQDELSFQITHVSQQGGGDINSAARIESTEGSLFVKWNDAQRFPGMFQAEARGLEHLRESKEIAIPQVLHHDEIDGLGFLLLNFVHTTQASSQFWYRFGEQLAEMHKHTNDYYGLNHDNYIGSLPQSNRQHKTWSDFFVMERLEPQVRLARNSNLLNQQDSKHFSNFFSKLDHLFPQEKPSLLHGDLWSGNYMVNEEGNPMLIDPAIYYGHREMDLSMTRLFGGFHNDFYMAYGQNYPFESEWEERIELCNLYPLLVHTNLFGLSYAAQVKEIVRKF
jgi:protein-ribulosamine 3-kinase